MPRTVTSPFRQSSARRFDRRRLPPQEPVRRAFDDLEPALPADPLHRRVRAGIVATGAMIETALIKLPAPVGLGLQLAVFLLFAKLVAA